MASSSASNVVYVVKIPIITSVACFTNASLNFFKTRAYVVGNRFSVLQQQKTKSLK